MLVLLVVIALDWRLGVRLRDDTAIELQREARLIAASWHPALDADSLADAAGDADGLESTLRGTGQAVAPAPVAPPGAASPTEAMRLGQRGCLHLTHLLHQHRVPEVEIRPR
ncbi:MAG TPA: hypothetical protein PKH96_22920, partial [Gemmatimonadaceae bacterium]|nr:hypothetical protein [Gemmatimonadaceae bacterium]